jgi:MFS superfamily sulfate permease-like transporter
MTIRFFSSMRQEIRGRRPVYWDDWKTPFKSAHALNKTLAAALYVFFTSVAPAITFAAYLLEFTSGQYGVTEVLFSTAICGVILSLFGGQPLLIVGVTGPISVFSRSLFECVSITSGVNAHAESQHIGTYRF